MNLRYKGNIIIDNELQIAPKSLTINYESLASDNSGRTLDGVMHIYWVFNRIRKLEITLAPTTPDVIASVFSRVQGKEYNITYWDTLENKEKTIFVYTSNSHTDCYSGRIKNGLYEGATWNAIEIAGELSTDVSVIPTITPSGDLVIRTINTLDVFSRSSNDLIVDVNTPGVSYEIYQGDLYMYEE